jgi:hypothetical protein
MATPLDDLPLWLMAVIVIALTVIALIAVHLFLA